MSTITLDDTRFSNLRLRAAGADDDTVRLRRGAPAPRHLHTVPEPARVGSVRLTRRGKAVIFGAAVAVIAVLAIVLGSSTVATSSDAAPVETTTVRVMPGHTLWQIAADANPNGDIRDTVDDIIRLNSMPSASALQMGSEIAVPVYR